MFIVYETTNLINGKYYVGVHKVNGSDYLGSGTILKKAIIKYGVNNFWRVTLKEFNTDVNAYNFERKVVDSELVKNINCYNIVEGGGGPPDHNGRIRSKETCRRISEALKGRRISEEHRKKISKANKGRTISEEHRKKIGKALTGRIISEETRKKLSEATKNCSDETRRKISEALKGRRISEEHRKKLSEALKGKIVSEETRRKLRENSAIAKVWFMNGRLFYSADEASKFFNISTSTLSRWCDPKSKYNIPLCYSIKRKLMNV